MASRQEIEHKLQRWKKFNDPVLLMIIFLTFPAVIMSTILSYLGDGTIIKAGIALCFLFFTWLAFKVNSLIKQKVDNLQADLEAQE